MAILRRVGVRLWRVLAWIVRLGVMLTVLRHSVYATGEPYYDLAAVINGASFDYVGWEAHAIAAKLTGASRDGLALDEPERAAFVRAYFDDLAHVHQAEAQVTALYADPNQRDPEQASAPFRAERDRLRASLNARQSTVEAALEAQVGGVLREHGFTFPPLANRFTGQTLLLVTSPRNQITLEYAFTLNAIPVDQRDAIERRIITEQGMSALIVPIGGMALYPAMIVESANLPYIIETFAHEWLHHYFMFTPLGWQTEFAQNPEARIINESSATLFGQEIAREVFIRYYPELLPPPNIAPPPSQIAPLAASVFDLNGVLNKTRVRVDALLARGKVAQAEAYMERQRRLLAANGYPLRRLNQAWFAFYGGYQTGAIQAGGADPTGDAVRRLREQSASLRVWVTRMGDITRRDALLAAMVP